MNPKKKIKYPEVKFKDWACVICRLYYFDNGRTALALIDKKTGEDIATATVNLPDKPLAKNEVFIKSWSENEGMAKALEDAGIIGPVLEEVTAGYATATRHKLLI